MDFSFLSLRPVCCLMHGHRDCFQSVSVSVIFSFSQSFHHPHPPDIRFAPRASVAESSTTTRGQKLKSNKASPKSRAFYLNSVEFGSEEYDAQN